MTTLLQQVTPELGRCLHFIGTVLRDEHLAKSQRPSGLKRCRGSFCFGLGNVCGMEGNGRMQGGRSTKASATAYFAPVEDAR